MKVEDFIRLANSGEGDLTKLCEIGEDLLKNAKDHERGRILGTLGNLNYMLGNLEKAEKFYREAMEIYLRLSQEDESLIRYVAGCLFNLGNLYHSSGKLFEAKECYTDALKTMEFFEDERLKAETLSALGLLEIKLGNYNDAEKLLKEAILIRRDVKDLNNLAVALLKLGKKEEARKVLKEALLIDRNLSIIQNLIALGDLDVEDFDESEFPLEIRVKFKYLKAKKLEKERKDASKEFFETGCLAFLAIRDGLSSINYMHCFDKAAESNSELSKTAEELKKIILCFYYGANIEVENLELFQRIKNRNFGLGVLSAVLQRIAEDIKGLL